MGCEKFCGKKSSIEFCLKFKIRLIVDSLEKWRLFSNHMLVV